MSPYFLLFVAIIAATSSVVVHAAAAAASAAPYKTPNVAAPLAASVQTANASAPPPGKFQTTTGAAPLAASVQTANASAPPPGKFQTATGAAPPAASAQTANASALPPALANTPESKASLAAPVENDDVTKPVCKYQELTELEFSEDEGAPERYDDSLSFEDRQPGYGSSVNSFERIITREYEDINNGGIYPDRGCGRCGQRYIFSSLVVEGVTLERLTQNSDGKFFETLKQNLIDEIHQYHSKGLESIKITSLNTFNDNHLLIEFVSIVNPKHYEQINDAIRRSLVSANVQKVLK